jgi:hypothetical protein
MQTLFLDAAVAKSQPLYLCGQVDANRCVAVERLQAVHSNIHYRASWYV